MTIRLHPPGVAQTNNVSGGRTYVGVPGTPQDIPFDDDARQLMANGWVKLGDQSGTTAQRPARPWNGYAYFDTTLSSLIHWDGKVWRGPTGSAV